MSEPRPRTEAGRRLADEIYATYRVQLICDAEDEASALDRAWQRVEKALPEGWHIRLQGGSVVEGPGFSTAEAWAPLADDAMQEFGDTPAAALNALADLLEAR